MHAEIVMIGTELLLGEIVDTNASLLARALRDIGLDLYYKTTVGDNEQRIAEVLELALDRSGVVITSGGIGPTVDDVTRQAVARATGRRLVYSEELEAQIAARFRGFGRRMADNNRRQAYLPEGALPLENPVGTAPCFLSEDRRGRGFVVVLPGVPRELAHMMNEVVIPLLVERAGGRRVTKVRLLRTCAVGESNVDRAIGDLMVLANPTVGLAAHAGQTDVRITAKADTEAAAEALLAPVEAELRRRLGVAIYGVDDASVAGVVGQLLEVRGVALGIVDALTGGQVARELAEHGYGERVAVDRRPCGIGEALEMAGWQSAPENLGALAEALAQRATPAGGIGLALLGPLAEGGTWMAVHAFERTTVIASRRFQPGDHVRRWLVIQGLDLVRRALLAQWSSPVD